MKILCATNFFPPECGGMQQSNLLLVSGLVKAGHEVELLHFGGSKQEAFASEVSYCLKTYPFSARTRGFMGHYRVAKALWSACRTFKPQYVLLLDEGMVRALGFLPAWWPKISIPFISINSGSTLTRGSRHFFGRANSFFVRRGYCWLDRLFVAQATLEDLQTQPSSIRKKVRQLPRPLDDAFFKRVDSADSAEQETLPIVFSCARAIPEKGGGDILKALLLLRQRKGYECVHFVFAGDGPALETWRQMTSREGLQQVTFLGHQEQHQLIKWYAKAYVCLFPVTVEETFGRVWIEAFSKGCPVISTGLGNLKNLVVDQQNGLLIEPHSPSAIAGAIETFLALDPARYNAFQKQALASAEPYRQATIITTLLDELAFI